MELFPTRRQLLGRSYRLLRRYWGRSDAWIMLLMAHCPFLRHRHRPEPSNGLPGVELRHPSRVSGGHIGIRCPNGLRSRTHAEFCEAKLNAMSPACCDSAPATQSLLKSYSGGAPSSEGLWLWRTHYDNRKLLAKGPAIKVASMIKLLVKGIYLSQVIVRLLKF